MLSNSENMDKLVSILINGTDGSSDINNVVFVQLVELREQLNKHNPIFLQLIRDALQNKLKNLKKGDQDNFKLRVLNLLNFYAMTDPPKGTIVQIPSLNSDNTRIMKYEVKPIEITNRFTRATTYHKHRVYSYILTPTGQGVTEEKDDEKKLVAKKIAFIIHKGTGPSFAYNSLTGVTTQMVSDTFPLLEAGNTFNHSPILEEINNLENYHILQCGPSLGAGITISVHQATDKAIESFAISPPPRMMPFTKKANTGLTILYNEGDPLQWLFGNYPSGAIIHKIQSEKMGYMQDRIKELKNTNFIKRWFFSKMVKHIMGVMPDSKCTTHKHDRSFLENIRSIFLAFFIRPILFFIVCNAARFTLLWASALLTMLLLPSVPNLLLATLGISLVPLLALPPALSIISFVAISCWTAYAIYLAIPLIINLVKDLINFKNLVIEKSNSASVAYFKSFFRDTYATLRTTVFLAASTASLSIILLFNPGTALLIGSIAFPIICYAVTYILIYLVANYQYTEEKHLEDYTQATTPKPNSIGTHTEAIVSKTESQNKIIKNPEQNLRYNT